MSINLTTFNIFWFPQSAVAKNRRDDADLGRIARVLARLDTHAFVFQEILDQDRLESALSGVAGHEYRLRQKPGGTWLTSGKPQAKASMKIVCAYDAGVLELLAAAPLRNPASDLEYKGRRDPYAMHLRVRATGAEFTLVGVHLKSGLPDAGQGDESAEIRSRETTFLASWLAGNADLEPGHFRRPPTEDVIVMGDCNATGDNFSLSPLHEPPLAGWHWVQSRVVTSPDLAAPTGLDDPAERWTTYLDRAVIDHAIAAPGLAARIRAASIYAFDLDPALDDDPGGGSHWLRRTTDYSAKAYSGAEYEPVENLYRISDHRPVRIALDFG